jgi:hypothetical protein
MGTHACELEDLSGQVLKNSGDIDSSLGSNTHLVLGVLLEETLDTTAGELFNHVSELLCGEACSSSSSSVVAIEVYLACR